MLPNLVNFINKFRQGKHDGHIYTYKLMSNYDTQ